MAEAPGYAIIVNVAAGQTIAAASGRDLGCEAPAGEESPNSEGQCAG